MNNPDMRRFAGRTAIVTGASRGIGLAIAERIIQEGGKVCVTGRKPQALEAALQRLGGQDNAMAVAGSADDDQHQAQTVRAAVDRFGRLDLLVNNVGINPVFGPVINTSRDVAQKILNVNVVATLSWVQVAHQALTDGHFGAIVNVASVAGLRPAYGIGFYGASKAAMIQLTQQLAMELAPDIRVNAVAPAVVKTRFAEALYLGKEEAIAAEYPLRRLGTPEDIAAAVAFLASDDAAWITGQILTADGGLTLSGGV